MSGKRMSEKTYFLFGFLCCLAEFSLYITRLGYNTAITEIVDNLGIAKSAAGVVSTGNFICYGAGLILAGYIGDKINPEKMILFSILLSSACNLLMPFMGRVSLLLVVWCANGLIQAMLWPPLARILSEHLDKHQFKSMLQRVSISAYVATILIYLLVPLLISVSGWRAVFFFTSSFGFFTGILWITGITRVLKKTESRRQTEEKDTPPEPEENAGLLSVMLRAGILPVLFAIAFQGILRDGVQTWMPSFLSENYSFGISQSILTAVVLPIFAILSIKFAAFINRYITNEIACAAVLFGGSFAAGVVLLLFYENSLAAAVVSMAVITGSMHGINLMLIGNVALYFRKYGKVSSVSGILNSFTYAGSAIATYAVAALSERYGWGKTVCSWSLIALAGAVICMYSIKKWRKFSQE